AISARPGSPMRLGRQFASVLWPMRFSRDSSRPRTMQPTQLRVDGPRVAKGVQSARGPVEASHCQWGTTPESYLAGTRT
ncbi:MAG: hypothetical protein AAGI63_00350, partial [Planctomycetota bacterium]